MNEIKTKITVDTQELEDATDLIEEVGERLKSTDVLGNVRYMKAWK